MPLSPEAKKRAAERAKEWRKHNKEYRSDVAKENKRERQRQRYRERTAEHRAYFAERAGKMCQTVLSDAHREAMQRIYEECRQRTHNTGIQHHVDHIFPIAGKHSCGLHAPWNLQILTQQENDAKGNKMPPDSEVFAYIKKRG